MDLTLFLYSLLKSDFFRTIPIYVSIGSAAIYYAVTVFGISKVFEKCGRKPAYAWIPFFNYYQLFDIAWDKRYGLVFNILDLAYMLLSWGQGELLTKGFRGFLSLFIFVSSFILLAIAKIKLTVSFGKNIAFCYGLIFMELAFFLMLGYDRSEYLGPTRRRTSPIRSELKNLKNSEPSANKGRRYMITLYRRRSLVALIAGVLVCVLTFAAISGGLIDTYQHQLIRSDYTLFQFFTVNSNILSMVGAAFMIPYAVEGIRRKRFVLPRWITLFQYSAAICTTMTMIFSVTFILATQGPGVAFGGMNFWLHTVCPVMALILLFTVETDSILTLFDSLLCLLPFFVYSLIYITNVVLVGQENGGWYDIYMFNTYLPATISAPLMYMFSLGIATIIRLLYNKLSRFRQKDMMTYWSDDASPVEINIELYGLGRYQGRNCEESSIMVPVDIFEQLAAKYDMEIPKMYAVFNKGVIDGLKEQRDLGVELTNTFTYLFGVPEKKVRPKKKTKAETQ